MIIGNFRSAQDKEAKQNLQKSLLEVEIANEAEREKRQKDFKNPYKPVAVPPQFKSNAELQKDRIEQEKQAITNMNELGFDYQKGAELSAWLSSSTINKLVAFNANFKGIKKELTETTNPKLLNLDFLKNYLEKYFEDMDINYGRKFGKMEQGGTPAPSTIDELQQILPNIEQLETLRRELGLLFGSTLEFQNVVLGNIRNIDREAEDLRENNQFREPPRSPEELKNRFIKLTKEKKLLEGELKEVVDLRNDIMKCQNLTLLYIAIVPTPETLNLIKMSLTQQERGDLIRRYIVVLRKLNILSNSGINELVDEVGDFAIDDYDGIKRFTRKTLNSLAFLSNNEGVNQLSKLQRDYEVLLGQNGKVGELDKIKRLNDIKEIEIERARDELRNTNPITLGDIIAMGRHLNDPNAKTVMDADDAQAKAERYAELELGVGDTKRANDLRFRIQDLERQYIKEQNGANRGDVLAQIDADAQPLMTELEMLTPLTPAQFIVMEKEASMLKKELDDEGGLVLEIQEIVARMQELHNKWQAGTASPKEIAEIKFLEKLAEQKEHRLYIKEKKKSEFEQELGVELNEYGTAKQKLKKTGIATSQPILSEAELTQKMKEFSQAKVAEEAGSNAIQAQMIATKKQQIKNYYQQFYDEIGELYDTNKKRINESLYNYINTRFQGLAPDIEPKQAGEPMDVLFSRLMAGLQARVELFLDAKPKDEILSLNPAINPDWTPLNYPKGKQNTPSTTRYGIGIKDKLQRHFKEDKKYLLKQAREAKDIKRILTDHIAETEPIERQIENSLSGNGLNFKHTRIKVGRGITAIEQPQYKTFGKYVIHYGHLIDRNIANFKYPSLGSIPAIKPVNITDDYKDFLIDTLNSGKANERALNKLSNDEKKHFERVVIGAGLLETFNLKRGYDGDEKKDSDRFILLRGEVMAGNNNDKLLKELRLLIIKLMSNGRIQRNEGTNMLIELSAI